MADAATAARVEAKLAAPETKLLAGPSEGWGARRVPRESATANLLTPAMFRSVLDNAQTGDIEAQSELWEVMEERDGELGSHLQTRKMGVTSVPWQIEAADDTPEAERAAEYCRDVIDQLGVEVLPGQELRGIGAAVFDLLDAVPKGFAVQEIEWKRSRSAWTPTRLIWRPQRWFTVADDGETLLIRADTPGGDDMEMPASNFVVHRVRSQSGFVWGSALLRRVVRAFIVRHFGWKDWSAFAEVFGMPARIGYLDDNVAWDSKEATQFWDALLNLGQDFAAMIRGSNRIELLERKAGITPPYREIIELAGREMVLAILGQVLTSGGESGGSYSLGKVHNQVRLDLVEADALGLGETLTLQLLRPIVRHNLGPTAPLPRWDFIVEEPEDLGALATTTKTAVETGARIPERWFREKLGYPEPEGAEPILVPAQLAALGGGQVQGLNTAGASAVQAVRNADAAGLREMRNQGEPVTDGPVGRDGLLWLEERRVATPEAWEALSPAGKQRAWWVTGLDSARTAQTAAELAAAYRTGATVNEVLGRLEELGVSTPGAEEPGPNQIPRAQAALVYHQNLRSAYGADRWIKAQRDIELRPYGQYHTAGDERVRPGHRALNEIVKPLTDEFWNRHTPPWEFGCRCRMTTLSDLELEMEGLTVADDAEEAARYQAALMLQDDVYGEEAFQRGWRGLAPEMARRPNVAALKAPANPDWEFDRRDAYWLEAFGGAPATETGRADQGLLESLPLVADLIGG